MHVYLSSFLIKQTLLNFMLIKVVDLSNIDTYSIYSIITSEIYISTNLLKHF